MSQTLTVTIAAVASSIDAINPALVSRLVEDVANAINLGGLPVSGSGSATVDLNNISTAVTWTVVKS
jgi:hypothetical protein